MGFSNFFKLFKNGLKKIMFLTPPYPAVYCFFFILTHIDEFAARYVWVITKKNWPLDRVIKRPINGLGLYDLYLKNRIISFFWKKILTLFYNSVIEIECQFLLGIIIIEFKSQFVALLTKWFTFFPNYRHISLQYLDNTDLSY